MAITVTRSAQSAGGANANSLTITSPAAGSTLVMMCAQSGSASAPTASGFTVNGTAASYNTTDSVWAAYKIADGTETTIGFTAASGGTIRGVCYWELAGAAASVTLDGTPQTTGVSAATGGVAYTTAVAGSIVLIGVGQNANSGTISAWSGTNVATNISTTGSRCFGGSFITTTTVSSTFTANWANNHVAGIIAIALQPPAAGNVSLSIPTATATAAANVPAVQLSAPIPTAAAAAAANVPGVKVTVSPAAAAASAAANVPGVALKISPAAAAATASAAVPGVRLGLAIPAAAATALAPVPTVTISGSTTAVPMRMLMGVGQ